MATVHKYGQQNKLGEVTPLGLLRQHLICVTPRFWTVCHLESAVLQQSMFTQTCFLRLGHLRNDIVILHREFVAPPTTCGDYLCL